MLFGNFRGLWAIPGAHSEDLGNLYDLGYAPTTKGPPHFEVSGALRTRFGGLDF